MTGRDLRLVRGLRASEGAGEGAGGASGRPLLREAVGSRLRRARSAQGRSLRDVAQSAGVSTGHLSQVERGLAEPSSEVVRAVCRALALPMSALLRAVAADLVVVDLAAAPPSAAAAGPVAVPAPVVADGVQVLAA